MRVAGTSVTMEFAHVGGGLISKDGGALKGFAVAGRDPQVPMG